MIQIKILLAPDSMKGSLSAQEVCDALEKACLNVFPGCQVVSLPLSDGGEGSLSVFERAWNARYIRIPVRDLMGRQKQVSLLISGNKAVIESAQAAGLPLPGEKKDVMKADSFGVGQMLLCALDAGAREIYVLLGGTGVNDGGMGMLRALGADFPDAHGAPVPAGGGGLSQIARVNLAALDPRLKSAQLYALTDVNNPLLGPSGATFIYGPQKGAEGEQLPQLENGMQHYAQLMRDALGRDIAKDEGAGAAGGLGAAMIGVLQATRLAGAEALLNVMRFSEHLLNTDLVLTAEGRMDAQTVSYGKLPAAAALEAQKKGVPTLAFVGARTKDADAFLSLGCTAIFPIPDSPMTLAHSVSHAGTLLTQAAVNALRVFKIGMHLSGKNKG